MDAKEILTDARGATGLNNSQIARVLGVDDRTVRRWFEGTRSIPEPVIRLAWLIARRPELADELSNEFGELK